MKKEQYFLSFVIGLALYLIATGLSFAGFSLWRQSAGLGAKPIPSPIANAPAPGQTHFNIDPALPRTEVCPINGQMFTEQEKSAWSKRRPLLAMIENHEEARPQSGLSFADVVYETVAEGGITRFMGVFYCGVAGGSVNLAPVRSARTYFLPWVLEYDGLYNHVGGAGRCSDDTVDNRAKALCQIEQWKIKDMDQFGISFPTCYRNYDRLDHPVATEHTMVCATDKLYKLAAQRGWTEVDAKGQAWDKNFVSWKFKDDAKEAERGASFSASLIWWDGYEANYGVRWDYDKTTNSYNRTNGGKPHLDLETKKQLTAKSIVVMYAKEIRGVDGHGHLLYANIGSGEGLLFQDGEVTKIIWKKLQRTDRTRFYDSSGKEVTFNRGQLWVEMLPIGAKVQY